MSTCYCFSQLILSDFIINFIGLLIKILILGRSEIAKMELSSSTNTEKSSSGKKPDNPEKATKKRITLKLPNCGQLLSHISQLCLKFSQTE